MRLVGRGHPALRATHDKTLEFSLDADVTERATCVLAVAVDGPPGPMAGPVRITVRAGDEPFAVDARAVSSWQPGHSLVVRRSTSRTPNTFAVDASATAADLPRGLAARLRDPATEVVVDIERRPSPPTWVFASTRLPAARAKAEVAAADHVLDRPGADPDGLTGRVLIRSDELFPGRDLARPSGVRVETVGLHPAAAVVAAAPWPGPVLVTTTPDDLATAPGHQLVVLASTDPATLLARAAAVRGATEAVLAATGSDPVRVTIGSDLPRLGGRDEPVWCAIAPGSDGAPDPAVGAALDALLADGVATKTVARALAALTGRAHRAAYGEVLARRAER